MVHTFVIMFCMACLLTHQTQVFEIVVKLDNVAGMCV